MVVYSIKSNNQGQRIKTVFYQTQRDVRFTLSDSAQKKCLCSHPWVRSHAPIRVWQWGHVVDTKSRAVIVEDSRWLCVIQTGRDNRCALLWMGTHKTWQSMTPWINEQSLEHGYYCRDNTENQWSDVSIRPVPFGPHSPSLRPSLCTVAVSDVYKGQIHSLESNTFQWMALIWLM